MNHVDTADLARELARRLRSGDQDPATLEACARALEVLADLYERSCDVIAKALNRGRDVSKGPM